MGTRTQLADMLLESPAFRGGYERAQANVAIGSHLRELRREKGWTQQQVAEVTGVDQADVSRLEDGRWGRGGIKLEIVERILAAYDMQVSHTVEPRDGRDVSEVEKRVMSNLTDLLTSMSHP